MRVGGFDEDCGDWRRRPHRRPRVNFPRASGSPQDADAPRRLIDRVEADLVPIDVLVSNAETPQVPPIAFPLNVGNGPGGHQHIVDPTRIDEPPFSEAKAYPLLIDSDLYHASVNDFSDVAFDPLPQGIVRDQLDLTYNNGYTPPASVRAQIGYAGGDYAVHSTTGTAGNVPYTFGIDANYRDVPHDPGEPQDATGGRPLDLTQPFVLKYNGGTFGGVFEEPSRRVLTSPWAWQHTPGDVDNYLVSVPAATPEPPGHISAGCDTPPRLELSAPGMDVVSAELGRPAATTCRRTSAAPPPATS